MNAESRRIRNRYLVLSQFIWLPTSLIVGVNTLFLLDGGLTNVEAFAANAIYTLGLVLFEIPTGMVADTWGRRTSYLLGAAIQLVGNLLYFWMWSTHGPFWGWAVASLLLGFGYTFFSGALEAWLVDALKHAGYDGDLDPIFARNQIVTGVAMLVGTIAGGFIAQIAALGAPYLVRAGLQLVSFLVAFVLMKDLGFHPERATGFGKQVTTLVAAGWRYGLKNRPVRWVMLAAPFYMGTGIYGFYAAQPYLLDLFGDQQAIGVAGIAAAGIAGTQVAGGFAVPYLRRLFRRRTHILIACAALTTASLVVMGLIQNFAVVVAMLVLWAVAFSASSPVRQAYINALIPSRERATVLSFDSMVSSTGGVVFQPILGRVADTAGYAVSYVVSGAIAFFSLPFLLLARRENVSADRSASDDAPKYDESVRRPHRG
ncbi:MAG: major facilitator superfamily 1 [Myxococcales bacterium]|nr:major facilitator superfamily 1 [Myxococcales bacterium]